MEPDASSDDLRREAAASQAAGRPVMALRALNGLIARREATAADWRLAGTVLLSVREFAQAIGAFGNAVALAPDDGESQYGLAMARFELGDVGAALSGFLKLAEETGNPNAWTSAATIIPGCPMSDHRRVLDVRQAFTATLPVADDWQPAPRAGRGRLRIGYVSAFFHRANYMKPVWALINGHDRARFEVCLFADDAGEDGLSWFQQGPADVVHRTDSLTCPQLIDLIRRQALDVLVDLNGYSVPGRLPVLAARLAPACVAWFNLYATSGLAGIDWIVGDESVIRPGEDAFFTERVHRLTQSYLTFSVAHDAPPLVPPPCMAGGALTFGSLVSQYKITPPVLDAWAAILRRASGSQLILGNRALASRCNRDWLAAQFADRGIAADRIGFLPPGDHIEFLRHYDRIDIALDAFPYNGGTTTTEALWQGVPVLAIDGDRWAARTSRSLLEAAGLAEFVAADADGYVELAAALASDPGTPVRLAALRSSMRERLAASPVCDTGRMVRAMEEFFELAAAARDR